MLQSGEREKEAIKSLLDNEDAIKCIVANIMQEFDKVSLKLMIVFEILINFL